MSQTTFAVSGLLALTLAISLPTSTATAADAEPKSKPAAKDDKESKSKDEAKSKGKDEAKAKDGGKETAREGAKDGSKDGARDVAKGKDAEKKTDDAKTKEAERKPADRKDSVAQKEPDRKDAQKDAGRKDADKKAETKAETKARDDGHSKEPMKADAKGKGPADLHPRELTLQQLQEALLRVKGKGTLNISAAPDPHYRSTYVPRNSIAPRKPTHVAHGAQAENYGQPAGHAPAVLPVFVNAQGMPVTAAGVPVQMVQPGTQQLYTLQPVPETSASREYIKARAAALTAGSPAAHGAVTHTTLAPQAPAASGGSGGGHGSSSGAGGAHWAYEGEHGPQAWASLKPEYSACANGTRQSPINIDDDVTLQGPAEPLNVRYNPSTGSVINNGHTIQVDVRGDNVLSVRGTDYKLIQFHAHHPAEERINGQGFAMVMHLVHRANDGRLAVIAVLLDPGQPNPLIQKVWTHMPLDVMDRVRLPADLLNLNELLPQDRRYYQFMGSLTTPPCTEGVLWIVLKQPVGISADQLRLFGQVFPMNARPVQPVNGRVVRNAN